MAKKQQKPEPIKLTTIELEGDYEGWEFEARTNAPLSVFGDLASGTFDRIAPALTKVVMKWNFLNTEGTPRPNPCKEQIEDLPLELVTAMSNKFIEELTKLSPN